MYYFQSSLLSPFSFYFFFNLILQSSKIFKLLNNIKESSLYCYHRCFMNKCRTTFLCVPTICEELMLDLWNVNDINEYWQLRQIHWYYSSIYSFIHSSIILFTLSRIFSFFLPFLFLFLHPTFLSFFLRVP